MNGSSEELDLCFGVLDDREELHETFVAFVFCELPIVLMPFNAPFDAIYMRFTTNISVKFVHQ